MSEERFRAARRAEIGEIGEGARMAGGLEGRTVFPKPVKARRGEHSSVQALLDRTEVLLCCSETGHLIMTRHSITSNIISADGWVEIHESPLSRSYNCPPQRIFAPFHPRHLTNMLGDACNSDGGWYWAVTWTREICLLVGNWWSDELLERPNRMGSPLEGTTTLGRSDSGARSESVDKVRCRAGRRGGDEGRIPVEDVGTGVGYDTFSSSMALNLRLLGSPGGEDENGSNAGSNEGCRVWFER